MPGSVKSVSTSGRVRQRAIISALAALLALVDWGWASTTSLRGASDPMVTGVNINGTRVELSCHGRGPATVVVIGEPLVRVVINDEVQAGIARSVLLCTLIVRDEAARHSPPPLADVLRGLLIGGKVSGPYAIITYASESAVSAWITGPLSAQTAGYVLIDPSPRQSDHVVVPAHGDAWPLPMSGAEATVLAILKLFWPPDEA